MNLSRYDVRMLKEVLQWCKDIDNRNCEQSLITVPRVDWVEEMLEELEKV